MVTGAANLASSTPSATPSATLRGWKPRLLLSSDITWLLAKVLSRLSASFQYFLETHAFQVASNVRCLCKTSSLRSFSSRWCRCTDCLASLKRLLYFVARKALPAEISWCFLAAHATTLCLLMLCRASLKCPETMELSDSKRPRRVLSIAASLLDNNIRCKGWYRMPSSTAAPTYAYFAPTRIPIALGTSVGCKPLFSSQACICPPGIVSATNTIHLQFLY
mmetsp:Transcript_64831/g.154777  ORF Transcript_64831/g.154777 Transcript_64831/m.154777 type:complete len:221 (-) Transcript_64831:66-728(-)